MYRTSPLIVLVLVAACSDRAPTAPGAPEFSVAITCNASVTAGTVICESPHPAPPAGMGLAVTLGGQGALVRLASSGTAFSAGTFSTDVTVENLISQPMNTTNGTTADTGGVKVFFHSGPTITGGSGTIVVANPTGTGTFTQSGQPFFKYSSGALLQPGATTAPMTWQFTLTGTVTSFSFQVFVTTRLQDEVSPLVALGLSRSPAALTIAQGGSGTTTISLTRTNFTGAVSLSLSGQPSGVTPSFSSTSTTGTSDTLTLNVGGSVTPGDYTLTVSGTTSSVGNRSTHLALTVTTVGAGNVKVDFSGCLPTGKPVWVGAKDGGSPWAHVAGVNDVYTFTISSGVGGLTYVVNNQAGGTNVTVQYMTQAEFTAGTLVMCAPQAGKTVNGTIANAGSDEANLSLGGVPLVVFFATTFQFTGVPFGPQDLVAYRYSFGGGSDTAIIRRSQDIADKGSLALIDFGSSEAFAPASATITVNGIAGGESVLQNMFYQVNAACATATLYSGATGGGTFTAFGIPSAKQIGGDFHGLMVTASSTGADRSITEYFHTLSAKTLTLPTAMPAPAITTLGTPPNYKRLHAAYMLPADYDGSTSFSYSDAVNNTVNISATLGYLGGSSVSLSLDDYSAVTGWDNSWPPATSSTGNWTVTGAGTFGSACVEGATRKFADVSGTF